MLLTLTCQDDTTKDSVKDESDLHCWIQHHLRLCPALFQDTCLRQRQNPLRIVFNNKQITGMSAKFLSYGLQYEDIEWFTRAAMVRGILKVRFAPAIHTLVIRRI